MSLSSENTGGLISGPQSTEDKTVQVTILREVRIGGLAQKPGTTVEVSDQVATQMIGSGRAEAAETSEAPEKAESAPKPEKRAKATRAKKANVSDE